MAYGFMHVVFLRSIRGGGGFVVRSMALSVVNCSQVVCCVAPIVLHTLLRELRTRIEIEVPVYVGQWTSSFTTEKCEHIYAELVFANLTHN